MTDQPPIAPDQREPETLTPPPRPIRRRGVGPFSLRQVTIAIVAMMGAAIAGTLATVPIGNIVPGLPVPDPSAFLIRSPIPGLRIGDLAPELEGDGPGGRVTLTDLDGNPVRLADLRGKAVWINFWASWCPPCQYETPTIRAIDQRYRDRGLVIVAIQVQQTVDDGRAYADRYGLEYTIGADVTGAVFHTYKVFALPTQFFIDPTGVVRQIVNGPIDEADAAALIESILPPAPSGATPAPVPSPS
ncbi:MAG TPA: TlpA disulfide reductase family protein [Candidatus Limnocylindria bacterium]|nr:TlpA disulfide reductase family protein [Candidatus Limnocylindria bacterium]